MVVVLWVVDAEAQRDKVEKRLPARLEALRHEVIPRVKSPLVQPGTERRPFERLQPTRQGNAAHPTHPTHPTQVESWCAPTHRAVESPVAVCYEIP